MPCSREPDVFNSLSMNTVRSRMEDREQGYRNLVEQRKRCRLCQASDDCVNLGGASRLRNPAERPELDSEHLGPYTRWQGNLRAPILVVGQDSSNFLTYAEKQGDFPGKRVRTNLRLVDLVASAGITIEAPERGSSRAGSCFFTNAVLCLKDGPYMTGPIGEEDFRRCGEHFLRPTIKLVTPRVVVTLGMVALAAVSWAFAREVPTLFHSTVGQFLPDLPGGARLFPVYHPARVAPKHLRSFDIQRAHWEKLGSWLAQNP